MKRSRLYLDLQMLLSLVVQKTIELHSRKDPSHGQPISHTAQLGASVDSTGGIQDADASSDGCTTATHGGKLLSAIALIGALGSKY
mgnify:CR=1 FL=1